MKLQKDEIAEIKKARARIKFLEEIIEETGQNVCDCLLLSETEEVNEYIWDYLYGNSKIESFIKFYNNKLKNHKK